MEYHMKKTLVTLSVVALAATSTFAVDTAACAGCHGANFEKAALGKSKIVKDLKKDEIITALKGYKDGSYGGAMKGVMKGQVAKLSDADIEAIATQIAGGAEAPKAEATATEKVVEAVKTEATAAATSAVESAKSAATSKAVEAATNLVK